MLVFSKIYADKAFDKWGAPTREDIRIVEEWNDFNIPINAEKIDGNVSYDVNFDDYYKMIENTLWIFNNEPIKLKTDVHMTGGGVHYSFEAIGLKIAAEQAFQMLRAGGTATVIGMIPPGDMVTIHGVDFLSEKKIQGSMMGSNRFRVDMPRFVDFYLQGRLHLDDLVSNRIQLTDINEGMAALETGEVARSVIMFND